MIEYNAKAVAEDKGAPYRPLKDGTWPATVRVCREDFSQGGNPKLYVEFVVRHSKDNQASGPVILPHHVPLPYPGQATKSREFSERKLGEFFKAIKHPIATGSFDSQTGLGKAVRVMTKWTKGAARPDGPGEYPDKAEIVALLAADAGQKPDLDLMPDPEPGDEQGADDGGDPFGGAK